MSMKQCVRDCREKERRMDVCVDGCVENIMDKLRTLGYRKVYEEFYKDVMDNVRT